VGEKTERIEMKVAMYYNNQDVRIEEMAVPEVGPGELLVKVEASGICGTDVIEWYRRDKVPLVLGHEIAGVVEEVGDGLPDYKKGDRVAVSHHVPCGECRYCKAGHESVCDILRKTSFIPGGFSEYLKVPAINIEKTGVYKLPDEVSFEDATFIEPLACAVRGQRLANFRPDSTVLVLGSGVAGLLHIKLARMKGAAKVYSTDICDFRLKAANHFGAKSIHARDYSPEVLRESNEGRLADLVIVCAGVKPAIEQALASVERGGSILFFAAAGEGTQVSLGINELFWKNEVTLTSSYAASPEEHRMALELIHGSKVDVNEMITHRLNFKDIAEGFKLVAEARDCMKVIVNPQK